MNITLVWTTVILSIQNTNLLFVINGLLFVWFWTGNWKTEFLNCLTIIDFNPIIWKIKKWCFVIIWILFCFLKYHYLMTIHYSRYLVVVQAIWYHCFYLFDNFFKLHCSNISLHSLNHLKIHNLIPYHLIFIWIVWNLIVWHLFIRQFSPSI